MIHDGVRRGFTAWKERFEAKQYAMNMLRHTAHRLSTAELRSSFVSWKVSPMSLGMPQRLLSSTPPSYPADETSPAACTAYDDFPLAPPLFLLPSEYGGC